MLYKKNHLFQKLFSNGGLCSRKTREKCRSRPFGNENNNNQISQDKPKSDNQCPLGRLTDKVSRSKDCSISTSAIASSSPLLAAKLRCDEWGLQGRPTTVPTPSKQVVTVPQLPTSPSLSSKYNEKCRTVTVRGSKTHHPSYKPAAVKRSHSMKERREAKKKVTMKHLGYSSSLECIHEGVEFRFY